MLRRQLKAKLRWMEVDDAEVVTVMVVAAEATVNASGVVLVVLVELVELVVLALGGQRSVLSAFGTGVVDDKSVDSLLLLDRKEWVHGWGEEGRPDLGPRGPIWEKGSRRRRLRKQARPKRRARTRTTAKTRKWTAKCSCASHVALMGVGEDEGEEGTRVDIRACRGGRSRGARRPSAAADVCAVGGTGGCEGREQ